MIATGTIRNFNHINRFSSITLFCSSGMHQKTTKNTKQYHLCHHPLQLPVLLLIISMVNIMVNMNIMMMMGPQRWMTTHTANRKTALTVGKITMTPLLVVTAFTVVPQQQQQRYLGGHTNTNNNNNRNKNNNNNNQQLTRKALTTTHMLLSNHHRHHRQWQHYQQQLGVGLYSTSQTEETTPTSSPISTTTTETTTSMETTETQHTAVEPPPPIQRLSAKGLSLDIKTITNHYDVVLSHMMSRNPNSNSTSAMVIQEAIQNIANQSQQRITLIQQRDMALNERRTLSDQIGILMRQQQLQVSKSNSNSTSTTETSPVVVDGENAVDDELEMKRNESLRVSAIAEQSEELLETLQTEMDDQLAIVPNLLDDQVPTGRDETDNEIVYTHGNIYTLPNRLGWPTRYCSSNNDNDTDDRASSTSSSSTNDNTATTSSNEDWTPAWHDDIATNVMGYMSDAAVRMSGSRFVALRSDIAQLERAIGQWMLDLHTSPEHNYMEVSVPYVVSRSTLIGTGQLPKFEDDLFAITPKSHTCNGEDAFLIPTAEVPITNLHRNEVLNEEDLPISYVALTPCFRAEAGSYGRDTKGLIRTHQFQKVELVKITSATTSQEQHELLTSHAEKCLQLLELPYRKVRLCSGDIGFSANHCYDLEVYLPGSQEYREISSCSNTGDFQSRRLSLRYRPKPIVNTNNSNDIIGGGKSNNKIKKGTGKLKPILCHTINGSGLAVGRTLVAILENYQRPDGSIVIPDVLRPYMKGKEVIQK